MDAFDDPVNLPDFPPTFETLTHPFLEARKFLDRARNHVSNSSYTRGEELLREVRAVLIHFRCPHCEKLLAIGPHKGGAQINCPMCAHPVTVPPRTEVEVPATTVVLPDLSAEWWLDAPAAEAKPTPPAEPDAWWLTTEPPPPDAKSANNQSPTG